MICLLQQPLTLASRSQPVSTTTVKILARVSVLSPPLENYDYKKGGHLILWELGYIIEFPPHSTILIPSAIVKHGNTPISEGEERMSLTQYTAGGLVRWAAAAFRCRKGLSAELTVASHNPLDMFMTIDEYFSKQEAVYS